MVRRLKEDIREVQGGFPRARSSSAIVIDGLPHDAPELELSRLLDEYRTAREERFAQTSSRTQAAAGLLVVGLQQRLLSSIEAFARSLEVHRRTVERQRSRQRGRSARARQPTRRRSCCSRAPAPTTSADVERRGARGRRGGRDRGGHRGGRVACAERGEADERSARREQELLDRDAGDRRGAPPPAGREDCCG